MAVASLPPAVPESRRERPRIPPSGGAVPARPRLSGPWRPLSLGRRWRCCVCHLYLSSTLWAWFPLLVTFLLCPLSPDLSLAGSSLPFPFLQGADSLPLSLPNSSHCQALWYAGYPQGGSFLTSQALFSGCRAGCPWLWVKEGWGWVGAGRGMALDSREGQA